MNRAFPADGHYIADCPFGCGAEDVCYVEPDGRTWMTTCGCARGGGIFELHAALLLQAAAA